MAYDINPETLLTSRGHTEPVRTSVIVLICD